MAQIKDLKRMCASHTDCLKCELYVNDCCRIFDLPDNIDEIVDEWAKEHPVKTYMQDFFEKFPNAPKEDDGTPMPCILDIYGNLDIDCSKNDHNEIDCVDCWNREMKGE